MGIIDSVLTGLSSFSTGMNEIFNNQPQSYCVLNTADSDNTLCSDNGSIVSVIRFDGSISMVGADRYKDIVSSLTGALEPFLAKDGYQLQCVMNYDPDLAKRAVGESMLPAKTTAGLLDLDLDGFLDDWRDSVSRYCSDETCYFVLWTMPEALSDVARKQNQSAMVKSNAASPYGDEGQKIGFVPTLLHENHSSYVSSFLSVINDLEIIHELMTAHDILFAIRKMVFPGLTGKDWKALLPGDPFPLRTPEPLAPKDDYGFMLFPKIGEQLFPDFVEDDRGTLLMDDVYYAPLLLSLPPQTPTPFNVLFRTLIRKEKLPFRVSFFIDSGGQGLLSFKSAMASILWIASSDNKKIANSVKFLEQNQLNGGVNVRFRTSFTTWGETREEAIRRRSDLAGAVQAWGSCDISVIAADPLLGVSATLPAFMQSSPASSAIAPIDETINLMPVSRPASPWRTGTIPLRSPDGRLMPYMQMSSIQASWVDVGVAPMGFGKSVWLNTQNLAFCLQPSASSLPFLSIIDIGPSSKGLVSLLKAALPDALKHQVAYHRLRMEKDYAINPFDLPLGNTHPAPAHESFLINFVVLLCTPVGKNETAPDSIPGLARAAIKAAYDEFSPKNNPKLWVKGRCDEVDKAVNELSLPIDRLTWFDIVDALYDQGDIHLASLAQRYAAPLLSDVASISRKDIVSGIYKGKANNSEDITSYFWRSCVDAINAYPILAVPTAFDIGDAKVVSLDLDEVAPRGGDDADRQSGVMYMLARHVVASRFFRMPADVKAMPEKYQSYHAKIINEIREQPKRISYDEFHRISRSGSVSDQIISDIETAVRESRKWNLSVGVYSQSINDIPDVLIDLSSAFFVMGVGSQAEATSIYTRFGLTKPSFNAMLKLRKPDRRGATMLMYLKTAKGNVEHLATNTLGSQGVWAFSSTTEDAMVRDYLYGRIGVNKTLKILSSLYPSGIKSVIEETTQSLASSGDKPPSGAAEWVRYFGIIKGQE